MADRKLKPGDVVEIRPGDEILATLDQTGALDGVPFMPEMLQYVGRRFTISKRVEKICDMVGPGGSRRMRDSVLLENLRCDGSAHGGCQADCRIYWKEAWLTRVDAAAGTKADWAPAVAPAPPPVFVPLAKLARQTVQPATEAEGRDPADHYYRCQATDAFIATEPLRVRQPGQYVREISSGNVSVGRFLRVGGRAVWGSLGRRLGFKSAIALTPAGRSAIRGESLDLKPGDWVQVKTAEEIAGTLDETGRNRGLTFTFEMLPSCGKTFRVKERVSRIVDEQTGKMLHFKNDCIVLEGSVCTGDYAPGRWFCPRDMYPYWREAWLRRVDPVAES